jgi:catalase
MFWRSMRPPEQDHIAAAFSFELGKVEVAHVRARMLRNLAEVDADLVERVAAALGMPVPAPSAGGPDESAPVSPALSQLAEAPMPIDGRIIAVLAADGVDGEGLARLMAAATAAGARVAVVGPHLGLLTSEQGTPVPAPKALLTAQSVEFDAVVVAGGSGATTVMTEPLAAVFVQEAYRHLKTVGGWGDGVEALAAFGIPHDAPGVFTAPQGDDRFHSSVLGALGGHRHWDRSDVPAVL